MNYPPVLAARGVYYLPWYGCNGEIYLVAVSRRSIRLYEKTVLPGEDVHEAEDHLRALLDIADPPVARLVK